MTIEQVRMFLEDGCPDVVPKVRTEGGCYIFYFDDRLDHLGALTRGETNPQTVDQLLAENGIQVRHEMGWEWAFDANPVPPPYFCGNLAKRLTRKTVEEIMETK